MDVAVDDTLHDDAWKDSFDKLLDQRQILRELNVIKRNVRASFNMNSSCENSCENREDTKLDCELLPQKGLFNAHNIHSFKASKKHETIERIKSKIFSTPIRDDTTANRFKCTLSPIEPRHVKIFKISDKISRIDLEGTRTINSAVCNKDNIIITNSLSLDKIVNSFKYSLGISPLMLVKKKWKFKQGQKQVCFDVIESNKKQNATESINKNKVNIKFRGLQPGKWRKSLNSLRRQQKNAINEYPDQKRLTRTTTVRRTAVLDKTKCLSTEFSVAGKRKSIYIHSDSFVDETRKNGIEHNDFKRQILKRCAQRRAINFISAYNEDFLQNCCKIGEGAFGEVFLYSNHKTANVDCKYLESTVLKIVPIEGKELINGEVQKTFKQILPEIIISMELCRLSNHRKNVTSGFVNLQRVRYVKGLYPTHLQKLWEMYDLTKYSENDHPKCFSKNQQYIVLELAYSGKDLESFHFKTAEQSFSALQQIIFTLAVGEAEYQFEHRDLHWGNILVLNTNEQYKSYKLENEMLTVPTKGIQITIIDYTLSRMTFNGYCFYNDLSNDDELFTATGDYQFDIYRMMKKTINNKWEKFDPKTNILWITYIVSKMVDGVSYTNVRSKTHLFYLDKLKRLQNVILTYKSCVDCARDILLY